MSVNHKMIVVVYVDHITTAGSHSDIHELIDHLRSQFQVTVNDQVTDLCKMRIS